MEIKKVSRTEQGISHFLRGKNPLILIIEAALLCVCIYGVYKSYWMNTVGVSLWLDEAMLAFSFSKRGLLNLTSGIFEWNQIAPVGWLYLNKIMAEIFGNTEFVIRLFSVFSYAATLLIIYHISKNYFHLSLPLLCPAYIASMSFALQYSIMFKPYISDGLFTMLAILLYLRYKKKNTQHGDLFLAFAWALLIWFSNPVCFVTGGIILSEIGFILFKSIRKRKGKDFVFKTFIAELKPWLIIGVILVISFVIYYFYWLRPVAIGDPMQNYWAGQNFPLFPKSSVDMQKIKSMKDEIFSHFSLLKPFMIWGLIATFIFGLFRKSRCIIGLYLGLLLMLFASYLNMFPVEDRMWYYFYPLASLLFFIGIDKVLQFNNEKGRTVTIIILAVFGIIAIKGNTGFARYSSAEQVFRSGEESNYEVNYVRENIKPDEKVYVYYHSIPGFQYNNGYDTNSIGNYENNVIYGSGFLFEGTDYSEDIRNIAASHSCYIVMSHWSNERAYGIMHDLPELGWLELVRNDYSTPLLFWTDDINKVKSHISMSIVESSKENGITNMTIRIQNDGNTILNSQFNRISLISPDCSFLYELPNEIKQGAYTDIYIEFPAGHNQIFELVDASGKKICPSAELRVD